MLRILILGSGAVAGLYAGKLKQAGCELHFWVRRNSEELLRDGFRVESVPWGNFEYRPDAVFESVPDHLENYDLVINCLKCLPEINLESILGGTIPATLPILLLQNGIGIEDPVVSLYPNSEILSGLAFVCANRLENGSILHLDYGDLTIGSWNRSSSSVCDTLVGLFRSSGVPVQRAESVRLARWKKLMWNAPFNPTGVLTGGKNTYEILSLSETRELVVEIMKEVRLLSGLDGAEVPESQIEDFVKMTEIMKPYKTSMLLDFEAGRPMEIDAILGNAVRIADRYGAQVPRLRTIYSLLKLADHSKGIQ